MGNHYVILYRKEKKKVVELKQRMETMKKDLMELCEDNEVMKQTIKEYFESGVKTW